jgi:hypothetical protein
MPDLSANTVAPPKLDWFASVAGARLLASEAQGLHDAGLRCRGSRALVVCGSHASAFELALDGPRGVVQLGYDVRCRRLTGAVSAAPDALPFSRESFGLIVLWHLPSHPLFARFDFAEAAELLQPEGEILLIGLNGLSAWRLHWQRYGLKPMRAGALGRRLASAGLEVRAVRGLGPRWPWAWGDQPPSPAVVQSTQLCASLLVQVRRRRPGMTAIPARRRLATARVGSP